MVWAEVQAAVEQDQPFTLSYRVRTAGGGEKCVWDRGRAVRGPDGAVEALEGFIGDITEQKRRRRPFCAPGRLPKSPAPIPALDRSSERGLKKEQSPFAGHASGNLVKSILRCGHWKSGPALT